MYRIRHPRASTCRRPGQARPWLIRLLAVLLCFRLICKYAASVMFAIMPTVAFAGVDLWSAPHVNLPPKALGGGYNDGSLPGPKPIYKIYSLDAQTNTWTLMKGYKEKVQRWHRPGGGFAHDCVTVKCPRHKVVARLFTIDFLRWTYTFEQSEKKDDLAGLKDAFKKSTNLTDSAVYQHCTGFEVECCLADAHYVVHYTKISTFEPFGIKIYLRFSGWMDNFRSSDWGDRPPQCHEHMKPPRMFKVVMRAPDNWP